MFHTHSQETALDPSLLIARPTLRLDSLSELHQTRILKSCPFVFSITEYPPSYSVLHEIDTWWWKSYINIVFQCVFFCWPSKQILSKYSIDRKKLSTTERVWRGTGLLRFTLESVRPDVGVQCDIWDWKQKFMNVASEKRNWGWSHELIHFSSVLLLITYAHLGWRNN